MNQKEEREAMPDFTFIADLLELMVEIPADTIISRSVYADDQVKGTLFGFAAGQELSEHTSARPATLHFLSGEAELMLGQEKLVARPGTWVHMPAQLPHSITAKTPTIMLLLLLR